MRKLAVAILLVVAVSAALGQNAYRVDNPVQTINTNVPVTNNMYPVLAIPNAGVNICNVPANGVPCTNKATTYTDSTAGTTCSTSTQFTRPNSNVCVANADSTGNWGGWFATGNYQYTITLPNGRSYGPYDLSVGTNGSSTGLPVNNPAFTGKMTGPSILASINNMVNVMAPPYNAKGDCVTDDTAAFAAAQGVAETFSVGNSLPAALVIPKPPGGCYIINDFVWHGVSLEGLAPAAIGPASPKTYPVTLKNSPGAHDILKINDPNFVAGQSRIFPGWSIRNIGFIVDNSIGGVRPHRWPGRWFDDGAMTNGSAVFTSSTRAANITCADVGQAIQVNGAGPGGANLVTTIQSVSPCWYSTSTPTWTTITLAASASTTVSNAHTYISVLGLPVTQTLGNAAIAQDLYDGNPAHWIGTSLTGNYGKMENVSFVTTNGSNYTNPNNYPVGVFTQGIPWLYGLDVKNFLFNGFYFGVAQTGSELNSFLQSSSGDYETWMHGLFFFNTSPWISYNGFSQHLEDNQIAGDGGPIILGLGNQAFDAPIGWTIQNMGIESPNVVSPWGWVITGGFHTVAVSLTSNAPSQFAYFEASTSSCRCGGNNVFFDGQNNRIDDGGGPPLNVVDRGFGNEILYAYNANPINGLPSAHDVNMTVYKGSNQLLNRFTSDFIRDGNPGNPYNNDDLFLWPQDIVFGTPPWNSVVVSDTTSPTGNYAKFTSGQRYNIYAPYTPSRGNSNSLVVGDNLPTTGITVYLSAKCPVAGTFTPQVQTFGGTVVAPVLSCTTSYQPYTINVPWAVGDSGKPFYFGAAIGSNEFRVAWFDIVPFKTAINGIALPITGGAQFTTGPQSGTTTNNIVTFADTKGTIKDSGISIASQIANIQITVPSFVFTSAVCWGPASNTTPGTAVMTGISTSTVLTAGYSSNPSAINGWGTTGGLTFQMWPTANQVNWLVCNPSGASFTSGSITFNVGAK